MKEQNLRVCPGLTPLLHPNFLRCSELCSDVELRDITRIPVIVKNQKGESSSTP